MDLADSALNALRQIIDDTATPAAVRYKAAIDVISFAQNHDEGRLYREGNILAGFHAELDAIRSASPPPASTRCEQPAPNEANEDSTEEAITEPVHTPVRNAPCPCGSRLKYKRCCGKIPLPALAA